MIFARKRPVVELEEAKPKAICGHISYDKAEYSMQNLLVRICISTALLASLLFTNAFINYELFFYSFAFILLGAEIFAKAIFAIKEKYFDENVLLFLIVVFSFIGGKLAEGLTLLIFYSLGILVQNFSINLSREKFYASLSDNLIKSEDDFGLINEEIREASILKVPNRASIKRYSFYLAILLFSICTFYFLYAYYSLERGFSGSFQGAVILLFACTPFALFFAIPVNSALAIYAATKVNIAIKGANFLYALDSVNLLLLDSDAYLDEQLVADAKIIGFRIVIISKKESQKAKDLEIEQIITDDIKYLKEYEAIRARQTVRKLAFLGTKEEFAPISARADVSICFNNEKTPFLALSSDIVFLEEGRVQDLFTRSARAKSANRANIILGTVYKLWAVMMAVYGLFTPLQVVYFDFFLVFVTILNSSRQLKSKK